MKISVIGAGSVGGQLAFNLALKGYKNVELVDIAQGLAEGKALDIMEASPVLGFKGSVSGSSDFAKIKNSDIVVITAGKPRQPGMTREDLLKINANIMREICGWVKEYAPECILILVTNPLDIMVYIAYKETGFHWKKVIGMAGVLDTARYKYFISEKTGADVKDVEAMILGPHGNTMVVADLSKIKGRDLRELLSHDELVQLKERARNGGKEVVDLLKSGSAFIAPSSSAAHMIDAIVNDTKELLPCCVYAKGVYGLGDLYMGLPVKLGSNGVEEIVEVELTESDREELVNAGRAMESKLKEILG